VGGGAPVLRHLRQRGVHPEEVDAPGGHPGRVLLRRQGVRLERQVRGSRLEQDGDRHSGARWRGGAGVQA